MASAATKVKADWDELDVNAKRYVLAVEDGKLNPLNLYDGPHKDFIAKHGAARAEGGDGMTNLDALRAKALEQRTIRTQEAAFTLLDQAQALPGRVMPVDVARAVLFLASDEAAMITKQTLVVDAGWI